jgi:uncharacterized Zn-finger protein
MEEAEMETAMNDENLVNGSVEVIEGDVENKKKKKVPVLANKKQLKCHQPAKCQICNKVLSSKYELKRHAEAFHENKKKFSCDQCPKAFYRKSELTRHITYCHTFANDGPTNSNRPFKCDFEGCGKFFKTKRDLNRHQRVHSGKLLKVKLQS